MSRDLAELLGWSRWCELVCEVRETREQIEQRLLHFDVFSRVLPGRAPGQRIELAHERHEFAHVVGKQRHLKPVDLVHPGIFSRLGRWIKRGDR